MVLSWFVELSALALSRIYALSLGIGTPSSMHTTCNWLGGASTAVLVEGLVPSRRENVKSSRWGLARVWAPSVMANPPMGAWLIFNIRLVEPVPHALIAQIGTVNVPAYNGVPVIAPVVVSTDNPSGSPEAPNRVGESVARIVYLKPP